MSRTPPDSDRFFFYSSRFDPIPLVERNCVGGLAPTPGLATNAFGVKIDPKFFPNLLTAAAGTVEPPPLPSNWHADIAEFGAVFRAIELSGPRFRMVELGCGWGCWMNISGVVAKRQGKQVHVTGVEGDVHHVGFARESLATNGFAPGEYTLCHGIATARPGTALFPNHNAAGTHWGEKPLFDLSPSEAAKHLADGRYIELPQVPLGDLASRLERIDLLHIDIQGGELDLVAQSMETLSQSVAYMMIGTHSRTIEGELIRMLTKAGWILDIERPAVLDIRRPMDVQVDGVQGWLNPTLFSVAVRQEGGIEILEAPARIDPGATFQVRIELANRSPSAWGEGQNPVRASYHWLTQTGEMLEFEGARTHLGSARIEPGTRREILVKVLAPTLPGRHRLKLTLLQEGIAWFDDSIFDSPTFLVSVTKD